MKYLSFLKKNKKVVPLWPMQLRICFSGTLLFIFSLLTGQVPVAVNPFEVASRLPQASAVSTTEGSRNPFDMVSHKAPGAIKELREEVPTGNQSQQRFFVFPKGNTMPKAFIFGILILLLCYFTFVASINRSILLKAWRSFLSSNTLTVAHREANSFSGSTPYFLLYANFLLNAGVFAYLIIQSLNSNSHFNNFAVFSICIIATIGLMLIKHVLLSLVAWLFPAISTDIDRYNFLIIIFSCVLGFFLIPFNFVIPFAETQNQQTFITLWLLALSGIFFIYGLFRAFSLGTKYLFGYPLHFLLYLCAAEIIPVLLVIKLLL